MNLVTQYEKDIVWKNYCRKHLYELSENLRLPVAWTPEKVILRLAYFKELFEMERRVWDGPQLPGLRR